VLTWTPLHRELGLPPRHLTYGDLEAVVERKVLESSDVEWKVLPPTAAHKYDIAYDVAAMANSGGGVICIGVQEAKGTSAAMRLSPISITDQAKRNLWQTVAAVVRPRISAFDLVGVPRELGSDEGVMVLLVRSSSSAPHLVELSGQPDMLAPIRQGASTAYMTEAELSRAYARRLEAGRSILSRHQEIVEDAGNRVQDLDGRPWLFAAAVPLERLPIDVRPGLEFEQRRGVAARAEDWARRVLRYHPDRRPILSRLQAEPSNQVRGPRGWFTRQGRIPDEPGKSSDSYLMLYDDGSSALGVRALIEPDARSGYLAAISHPEFVSVFDVESLAADFFALLDSHSRAWGGIGPLSVRLHCWSGMPESISLVEPNRFTGAGAFDIVDQSLRIREIRDVLVDYEPDTGEWNRRRAAVELAADIVTQFGVAGPFLFSDNDPSAQSTVDDDRAEASEDENSESQS
jgi:hypothetical protein